MFDGSGVFRLNLPKGSNDPQNSREGGGTDTADKSAFIASIFDCRFVEAMSF